MYTYDRVSKIYKIVLIMAPNPRPESAVLIPPHFMFGAGFSREERDHIRYRRRGFPEHCYMFFTTAGRAIYGLGGGVFHAGPGDVVLNFPRSLHDWRTDPSVKSWDGYNVWFKARPHWGEWMQWNELAPGIMHRRLGPRGTRWLTRRMNHIVRWCESPRAYGIHVAMAEYEKTLIQLHAAGAGTAADSVEDARLRRAILYIANHLAGDLSIARVANESRTPRNVLFQLFRAQMGLTPTHYIERQRIQLAAELLRNKQMPVKTVAASVGYANAMYFSTVFKRRMGLSPRLYRRRWT